MIALATALAAPSLVLLALAQVAVSQTQPAADVAILEALDWREVGPYRGGRCAAVTGVAANPNLYYMGAAGGGVWQSADSGRSWRNISDGFFGGSIGAVTVAESDPNVIYVGGGEKTLRGNVSHGDGMWRSTDAGRTWQHIGLPESRHVCRVRVHPTDPDLVYAAALGHLFGPNEERGVYRSRDGGANWERILFRSDRAGAVDLAMDPTNPRILYASLWQVRRTPYSLESGGPDSGIWKSTDGGDTWTDITRNEGLPTDTIGISGLAVSRSNPDNVYAIVESEDGGVFRSKDAGKTWKRVNTERSLRQRAWYYSRIYADPVDEDVVYVLNVRFWRSKDGGVSFASIDTPHGDNHDLWIAADDPQRMIEGNDGGANVSHDGGKTWSRQDNQPTAQIYRVSTDNAEPYRLLGGQQDNSALRIRSRSLVGSSIGVRDWEPTAGGESGHVVAKPDDPDLVVGGSYGGYLNWINHRTGERRAINVWPENPLGWGAAELRHRFQWNFPLFFSPHDSNVLYAAGETLFRSEDLGASWEPISYDLTTNDKSKQGASGGPITKDNTGVEIYCTIFAALESPHEPGVLWAASDDGLLHLSRDAGTTWRNRTPEAWPKWLQINCIDAHPTEPGGLYVAATMYKSDDFAPYLFKTTDYGRTWSKIVQGIDPQHFTRAIRADPARPGVLYAGTERGVYVSLDDGGKWLSMQGDLPIVPITDLAVKHGNLVAATQGRGFWILDELALVRQLDASVADATAHLFEPAPAARLEIRAAEDPAGAGQNPAVGAVFHYHLGEVPAADAAFRLEVLAVDGTPIRTFGRKPDPAAKAKDDDIEVTSENDDVLEFEPGLNRFVWDLRYAGAEKFPKMVLWNSGLRGPRAVPGTYQARLTVGEWTSTVPFEVIPDPLSSASHDDRIAQFEFAISIREKLTETHREIRNIRDVRGQLDELTGRVEGRDDVAQLREAASQLRSRITKIEAALYQTKSQSRQDPLNFPIRLNDKLAGVLGLSARGDQRPTAQVYEVAAELTAAIDAELAKLRSVWDSELPALNRLVEEVGIPRVTRK